MLVATIIGIYAQDITYYIGANILGSTPPLYILTILTAISILLFLIVLLVIQIEINRGIINKQKLTNYFIVNIILGGLSSIWLVFVLIMSWG